MTQIYLQQLAEYLVTPVTLPCVTVVWVKVDCLAFSQVIANFKCGVIITWALNSIIVNNANISSFWQVATKFFGVFFLSEEAY